jgi:uncharacterized protein (TIGR01777 family)
VVALGRNPQAGDFAGIDAVVHLAGEPVSGRWTEQKKRAIRESRVAGTHRLVEALEACDVRPATLVSASAVGFYGSRGDEPLDETSSAGEDFLAGVCFDWEAAARAAEALGMRSVQLRTGIVLGKGGALAAMEMPFRLGLGGPFGNGRQFVPWIHIDDVVALYLLALDRGDLRGAVNAVTPDYATSARFSQALGTALHRPAFTPAPSFALRAVLGEFTSTILASQLVLPTRALDAGFIWQHPVLEDAMVRALDAHARAPYGVQRFETTQVVEASLEEVFAFFSNPRNLEALTPASLNFGFRECPATLERGSRISYKLRLHGLPMSWETLIAEWEPPLRFVDVQLHGPYASWHHEHLFERTDAGVAITDRVRYVLSSPLGALAQPIVEHDVERIFAYRRQSIADRWRGRQEVPLRL